MDLRKMTHGFEAEHRLKVDIHVPWVCCKENTACRIYNKYVIDMCTKYIHFFFVQIRAHKGCTLSRILLHLFDIWNILDFLYFTLYILGFCMYLFDSSLLNLLILLKRFGIIIIMVIEMVSYGVH